MAVGHRDEVVRVLVADESQPFSQSLKAYLQKSCKNVQVAGSAVNRTELLKILGTGAVDVALIGDGFMDGAETGGQTLRSIHRQFPQIKLVALLKESDAPSVVLAFRSGARGLFDRSESNQSLCNCIQAVHQGQIWASSKDLQHVTEELIAFPDRKLRS